MLTELARVNPNRVELVEVIGRLDAEKGQAIGEMLRRAIDSARTHIIIDLSRVDYINSTGLRELFFSLRQTQACGLTLYLVNPSERVRKLLELVGLDQVFAIGNGPAWDLASLPRSHRSALYQQTRYC